MLDSSLKFVVAALVTATIGTDAGLLARPASAAPAEDKKKAAEAAKANQLSGELKTVDLTGNKIRILSTTKDPNSGQKSEDDRTLPVAADARVFLAGKGKDNAAVAKLADLKDGTQVIVTLSGDKKTVTEVRAAAKEHSTTGAVRATDPAKNTLTITSKDKAAGTGKEETFAVAPDATVQFAGHGKGGGKAGRLADLKVGMSVSLRLTEDRKTALAVTVPAPTARGVLKEIDAAKGSITVTVGAKTAATDTTYEVGKATDIRVGGKEAKLADVKTGTQVELLLAPGGGGVVGIRVGEKGKVK